MEYKQIFGVDTTNPLGENKYTVNNPIYFGKFTSCIGLVGKAIDDDALFGIHLVQKDDQDFDVNDANKVADLIRLNCDTTVNIELFGFLDSWAGKYGAEDPDAYYELKEKIKSFGYRLNLNTEEGETDEDGYFTAGWNGAGIDLNFAVE